MMQTRDARFAFGPECRQQTEAFIGYPFYGENKLQVLAAQVYLTPSWTAYLMPSGEVAVIFDKVASRYVLILPSRADYWQFSKNHFADCFDRYKL